MDICKSVFQTDETTSTVQPSESKNNLQDLLEPQLYPDPVVLKASLEKITKDDNELKKNLISNKATLRVLAPYLNIIQKDQKRFFETARSQRGPQSKDAKLMIDYKHKQQFNVVPDITDKFEMIVSIDETADVLKALVKANNVVSYLVNPARNELHQSPRHVISNSNLTWKIETGSTMAAYAAATKQYVLSNDVLSDQRFPLGLGFPDSTMKVALCVPIQTPDAKVVSVYELTRDAFESPFDNKDIELVLGVTSWMGVAILQNSLYTSLVRQHELTNYLLQLTTHYHACNISVDKSLSDIVIFAREIIGADRCSVYVIEKWSNCSIIAEVYDQGVENSLTLFKKRTKKHIGPDQSTLSKVMMNQEIVNKQDPVSEMISDMDTRVRSLLCVPIVSHKQVIGAIQLINKKKAARFNKDDEETLQKFATFCTININHLKIIKTLRRSELVGDVNQEMLFYHMKPCVHDGEAVKKLCDDLPDQFFTFTWYPSAEHIPRLVELTISMFHEVFRGSSMMLNNIPKFVLTVKNSYRTNPYHNFLHAFGVTHAMANIISRYHRIFTGIERKALMVAALCHDLDHRGYTNNFLQLTKHYLSTLYDTSPLENHHFAVTKMIMQQCGMFKHFKTEIYNELMNEIYECIIATDLSLYFQCRMELMRVADENAFTFKNPSHRRLVKSLMMTACDLSGQTKPLPICKKITEDVYEEFFQQGDIEKKMGYVPLPTMDRNKKDMIAENQVQFLSVVVLPCVETVSRIFSTLSPMVWDSRVLLKQWTELIDVKDEVTCKSEKSVPSGSD